MEPLFPFSLMVPMKAADEKQVSDFIFFLGLG
jgi:hypothetical protein